MRLYRLVVRSGAGALDGEEAARFPGRWNRVRRRAVYASTTPALALLEMAVQCPIDLGVRWRGVVFDVDEGCLERLDRARLPAGWCSSVGREGCRSLGDAWLAGCGALGLVVPSPLVAGLWGDGAANVLLNPRHPAFAGIAFGEPFALPTMDGGPGERSDVP